jgi:hypothetical protein
VESDERKNIYDGVVVLMKNGSAEVNLPSWFEMLNCEFRYQLTPLGKSAPDLHIERELESGTFSIAGGNDGQRVCWQITGRRRDAWAEANPQSVELVKSDEDLGLYRHPELFGHGCDKSIDRFRRQFEGNMQMVDTNDIVRHAL